MEVADSDLKGHITTGMNQANVLTLTATIMSGSIYGNSYYCYAWDSDDNCTDEVWIVAPGCTVASCPTEVGTIDVVFTKTVPSDTFFYAVLSDDTDATKVNSEVRVTQSINDQFGDTATGVVIGATIGQAMNDCCVGVNEQIVQTTANSAAVVDKATVKPVSEQLARTGKVADKVLRRLRALERVQAAVIAARTN